MKRRLGWVVTLAMAAAIAVTALAVAREGAAKEVPVVVRAGNLILTLNGGLTPSSFPKRSYAPAGFHSTADLASADGTQPPAVREVTFDLDRDISIDVHGIPTCNRGRLTAQDTAHAIAACGPAILGQGEAVVRVAFPEQGPIKSRGPLFLFNGGVRGGTTTLYLYSYVNVPAPTAVVAPLTITHENEGRYGTHGVVAVPSIAGGHGSVVHTELRAERTFMVGGERRSGLRVRCSRGFILARASFLFGDGSALGGSVLRACA